MCDLTGPFKLCTCSTDVDKSKPHWVLHRFLETMEEVFVCGLFNNPNLYELYLIKQLKKRLNTTNVFDFEYSPLEGDFLEFFIQSDWEEEDEIMPDYRFEYKKGKWKYLEDFETDNLKHKSVIQGIIKGQQTKFTQQYLEFLENASEESIESFNDETRFFKTPPSFLTLKNLTSIFEKEKYGMYKFYKGETENPYKEHPMMKFWWMEMVFENEFYLKKNINDWLNWFGYYKQDLENFLANNQVKETSYVLKKVLFDLWLLQSWEHYGYHDKETYYSAN